MYFNQSTIRLIFNWNFNKVCSQGGGGGGNDDGDDYDAADDDEEDKTP